MLEVFHTPISWGRVARNVASDMVEDDVLGLAAEMAYYFFLALFPALLFLVALASFFPLQHLMEQVVGTLASFAPGEVLTIVEQQMKQIAMNHDAGLLTIGILATIWSASSAVSATMSALNAAYDIAESRPWWKTKLIALGITIAGGIFVLVSFALIILGPMLAGPLANRIGLSHALAVASPVLQWPIVFFLIATAMGFVYYFGPDAEQRWEWITPGSVLATILWILSSLGFRFYVSNFGNYNATYGTIGGVIVAMLWLYITALAILVGAETNAAIEHAAPWGKEPGEKRPGERKRIGRAAAEAYEQSLRRAPADGAVAVPTGVPQPARAPGQGPVPVAAALASPPRRRASDRLHLSDLVVGGLAVAAEIAVLVRSRLKKTKA